MGEPKNYASEEAAFADMLMDIKTHEEAGDYAARNRAVLLVLFWALDMHYPAGIRLDPSEPEWPVVFIELPDGQVSWHLAQHVKPWDGHTTEQKWARVQQYYADYYALCSPEVEF
jgi:hypothetical protein